MEMMGVGGCHARRSCGRCDDDDDAHLGEARARRRARPEALSEAAAADHSDSSVECFFRREDPHAHPDRRDDRRRRTTARSRLRVTTSSESDSGAVCVRHEMRRCCWFASAARCSHEPRHASSSCFSEVAPHLEDDVPKAVLERALREKTASASERARASARESARERKRGRKGRACSARARESAVCERARADEAPSSKRPPQRARVNAATRAPPSFAHP